MTTATGSSEDNVSISFSPFLAEKPAHVVTVGSSSSEDDVGGRRSMAGVEEEEADNSVIIEEKDDKMLEAEKGQ